VPTQLLILMPIKETANKRGNQKTKFINLILTILTVILFSFVKVSFTIYL